MGGRGKKRGDKKQDKGTKEGAKGREERRGRLGR